MSWKKETCKKCYFRVKENCRKLSPSGLKVSYNFPIVKWGNGKYTSYQDACSLYQEKELK